MSANGLHVVDILVLASYVAALLGMGLYFARHKRRAAGPEGAGFGWAPLGLSLMAATNSGIDYVQTPAAVYAFGLIYLSAVLSWVPVYFWATRVTAPFFRKLNTVSIYEYLEQRFNVWVRTLAAATFVLWRVGWMGTALYVPCLAIKAATGADWNVNWLVVPLGCLVTTYTLLGSTRAVVWMGVLQFTVMFGGVAVILAVALNAIPGGLPEVLSTARDAGRLNFTANIPGMAEAPLSGKIYLYLTTELTLAGFMIYILIAQLASFTCDQVSLQRLRAAESLDHVRGALKISAVASATWTLTLGLAGLSLFAFFHAKGLPASMRNDSIVPHFISSYFPTGWTGLVFGGIFAASLASVGAAMQSTKAVILRDFFARHAHGSAATADGASSHDLSGNRGINFALGLGLVLVASQIENFGEIYTAANKVLGAFFGPLLGIFLLGMFTSRATGRGACIGAALGLLTSYFLSFFSQMQGLWPLARAAFGEGFVSLFANISWQWSSPLGVAITVVAGYLLSARGHREEAPVTYAQVMRSQGAMAEAEDQGI